MNKLSNWIRKELVLHLEFYGYRPYARVGWIWVLMAIIFGYHWFGLSLCIIFTIIMVYNLLNRW